MRILKRFFGFAHVFLGLAVGIQFVANPLYDPGVVGTVWDVLNVFMAFGALSAVFFSITRMLDADVSDRRAASMMMMGSGVLLLTFFEQWFTVSVFADTEIDVTDHYRGLVWIGVDVLFVVMNVGVGQYLLRTTHTD